MLGGKRQEAPAAAPLELLPLALSRPREALTQARAILAAGPEPYEASIAHHAVGIVLRDFGDVIAGIREMRAAVRLARRAGNRDREADALATLGNTLVMGGHTRSGLAALDAAVQQATGALAGRVLMRRGGVLAMLGRYQQALDDLRPAVAVFRRTGDMLWEARTLAHRTLIHLALGSVDRAEADIDRSEQLFAAVGQELEFAFSRHNRGLIAFRLGNLPAALAYFDEAAQLYEALEASVPDLSIDRCAVLMAAGLPREALQEADSASVALDAIRGQPARKAELLLSAARAAFAADDMRTALERGQAAYQLFRLQQRDWWRAHARLLVLQARAATNPPSSRLMSQAGETAVQLDELRSTEAPLAHLLAGRMALALGRSDEADRHLGAAARMRRRGPALSRATGWLAQALRAEAAGESRRVLSACRRGLAMLDEHVLTLGASELRAQATVHGVELAALAQRQALRSGRARDLLVWSERWRAVALAVPPVRPPDDPEVRTELAAVRDMAGRVWEARARGAPTALLERQQQQLERWVRARTLRLRGGGAVAGAAATGTGGGNRFDVTSLLKELEKLGAAQLVQIVEVDGDLHVLVCGAGKVRRFAAGRVEAAAREVELARFRLRLLAGGRPALAGEAALALLDVAGERLEAELLGEAARHLGASGGCGPVVVVPPGKLHAVPWGLLPALRDRAVSVAPSASVWLRARRAVPPERRRVVLVLGPGLGTIAGEVPALAERYDDVAVLGDGGATAERVLAAMDGAWLVHVAAHGTFRADSPLFSSLRVDDGPLTVYDLERLGHAPYRLVLGSCDSGLLAPAGADELLGLTTSLVALGTVGIVASVVPVNDVAAMRLMLLLHEELRGGATLAAALRHARQQVRGDPALAPAAWSFLALGAD